MKLIPPDKLYKSVIGYALGDAYGIPFEMEHKYYANLYNQNELMIGFRTHNQPEGTWSDDTSMVLATMDTLGKWDTLVDTGKGVIHDEFFINLMHAFSEWRNKGTYGCHGECFDVGFTTDAAIKEFELNKDIHVCGRKEETDCGNGSLMRMLPIGFASINLSLEQRYEWCVQFSSLTHANPLNFICCFIYVELVAGLISGLSFDEAYEKSKKSVNQLNKHGYLRLLDLGKLNRILNPGFANLTIDEIHGQSYVVNTLEAVIWIILNRSDYKSTITLGVTLGNDTDTIAALAGGLCGIIYEKPFPHEWMEELKNIDLLMNISSKFVRSYPSIFNTKK
jgi:ADP-ribosyl-[dinitrogen reductase] hydrolase